MKLIDKLAEEFHESIKECNCGSCYYRAGFEKYREMAITELTQLIVERNGRVTLQEIEEALSVIANEEVEG